MTISPRSGWWADQILRNDIDEEYFDIQTGMRRNIAQILQKLVEELYQKRSKEFIQSTYNKMLAEFVPRDLAVEVVDILYQEESMLKTAILERVEAEVIKESNRQRVT